MAGSVKPLPASVLSAPPLPAEPAQQAPPTPPRLLRWTIDVFAIIGGGFVLHLLGHYFGVLR